MSKFIGNNYQSLQSGQDHQPVYHCIPVTPEGDGIRTSTNYGKNIPPEVQKKLSLSNTEKTPLVFAATHITKSMAFGLQGNLGEKLFNSAVENSDNEMVLACDRKALMERERDITIYKLSGKDFEVLPNAERQAVSTKPVPFSQTEIAFKGKNAEDLMRGGLQILAFNESFQELNGHEFINKTMAERGHKNLNEFLGDMVREGKVIWQNRESGINPDPALAKQIGVSLSPTPQKPAPQKPVRSRANSFAP